jgi:quaternary ammonium compound-resistance protein SugE
MAWFFLLLAGACEMVWPLGFKYTNGFKVHAPVMVLTLAMMTLSFYLMSVATAKGIPVGTAYAVWTGIGAAGTAILGMMLFNDPRDAVRITCLTLIIIGAIGLKFWPGPSEKPPAVSTSSAETVN